MENINTLPWYGNFAMRSPEFPYVQFRTKADIAFLIFFLLYILLSVIFILTGVPVVTLLTVSIVSSILAVMVVFFDSSWLRGILWSIQPIFIYVLVVIAITEPPMESLSFVVTHVLNLSCGVYLTYVLIIKKRSAEWYQIMAGGLMWLVWLGVWQFLLTDITSFPYNDFSIMEIIIFSTASMTVLFYYVNKSIKYGLQTLTPSSISIVKPKGKSKHESACFVTGNQGVQNWVCFDPVKKQEVMSKFAWDEVEQKYCMPLNGNKRLCITKQDFDGFTQLKTK